MRHAVWAVVFAAAGSGAAWAQDGGREQFERRMRELEERFRGERERLEREFRDRLEPRREAPRGEGVHELLERVLERLERLERKLDEARPRFDFKELERKFEGFDPKRFQEMMPRFRRFFDKDGDFDFDFRRPGPEGREKMEEHRERMKKAMEERRKHEKHEDKGKRKPSEKDDDESEHEKGERKREKGF